VHIHGGEVTEGAMDEAIRHALTKLSALHFVAAEPYRQRVIQMGEAPERVFNVGAPGLDVIRQLPRLSQTELENSLAEVMEFSPRSSVIELSPEPDGHGNAKQAEEVAVRFTRPLFLVTYHPVTWGDTLGLSALHHLFAALEAFPNATVIWTAANTDAGGQELNEIVQKWAEKVPGLVVFFVKSLGSQRYLSALEMADAVVGNSSSGIIEAPTLKTPTVNIGSRQDGRLRAESVIDCGETTDDIVAALRTAMSDEFKTKVAAQVPVYGEGNTAKNLVAQLYQSLNDPAQSLHRKRFYDLPSEPVRG